MLSSCHQVERAEVDAVVTVRLVERREGRREAMEGYAPDLAADFSTLLQASPAYVHLDKHKHKLGACCLSLTAPNSGPLSHMIYGTLTLFAL